jgi:hypothetical protein
MFLFTQCTIVQNYRLILHATRNLTKVYNLKLFGYGECFYRNRRKNNLWIRAVGTVDIYRQ